MVICSRSECQTTAGCAHRGPHFELCWFPSTAADIRAAVLVERERCAKIAEEKYADPGWHFFLCNAGVSIAAAIRAEPKEGE